MSPVFLSLQLLQLLLRCLFAAQLEAGMFRIRKITDPQAAANAETIAAVAGLLKNQFALIPAEEFDGLTKKLIDPRRAQFRTEIFVAEDAQDRLRGAAVLHYAPDLQFLFLDYVAVPVGRTGAGVGGALYQHVREEAIRLKAVGVFFECLPDDPALCRDGELLKQNVQRLRFYERFGARPIIGTLYATPVRPGEDCPPYLVFDDLGLERSLSRESARSIVRAILERKYRKQALSYVTLHYCEVPTKHNQIWHTAPRHGSETTIQFPDRLRYEPEIAPLGGLAVQKKRVVIGTGCRVTVGGRNSDRTQI